MRVMFLISLLAFLTLSFLLICVNCHKRQLVWKPSSAGLFSQFVQLKIMYEFARMFNRTLVFPSFTSPHYKSIVVNMCEVFDLPNEVECSRVLDYGKTSTLPWTVDIDSPKLNSDTPTIYYKGNLPIFVKTIRDAIVRAVSLPLEMKINRSYESLIREFKKNIGLNDSTSFTAVHWRRGDQLTTRCTDKVDKSVNCGTAVDLIREVKQVSQDQFVFVASNEKHGSTEVQLLHQHGMLTFANASMDNLSIIEVFVVEVALMLEADTFLAWGVSASRLPFRSLIFFFLFFVIHNSIRKIVLRAVLSVCLGE